MEATCLSLIVLRSVQPDTLAAFYAQLGMTFVKHRHGEGPKHFSADLDHGVVFEIYPQKAGELPTTSTRLGFGVGSVDKAFQALIKAGAKVVSEPKVSEWGMRAVVDDPEGHRIELIERKRDADSPSARQVG